MLGRFGVQQWPLLEALPHWSNNTDNVRMLGGPAVKPAVHPAAAMAAHLANMGYALTCIKKMTVNCRPWGHGLFWPHH